MALDRDGRPHELDGETVILDYVRYMPMGYKVRWRAFAKDVNGDKLEFWMFGEHERMLRAAGQVKLPRRAGAQHHFGQVSVLLEWEQTGENHVRGYRMIGAWKDDEFVGDPRAIPVPVT